MRYIRSLLFFAILLCILISSAAGSVAFPDDITDNLIDNKGGISTELLQLIDITKCPPDKTPEIIFEDLAQFNQTRINYGEKEVHVTVGVMDSSVFSDIEALFTESVSDPNYNLISGWLSIKALSALINRSDIKTIELIIPPISSGTLTEITPEIDWKKKLSTDLLQITDNSSLSPGQNSDDIRSILTATGELKIENCTEYILVSAKTTSTDNLTEFFQNPAVDSTYHRLAGWIKTGDVRALAKKNSIIAMATQLPPVTSKICTEGDIIMNTAAFRNVNAINGDGIKVGVISDGVKNIDALKASGELPDVKVIRDIIGGEEGTAMLQVIHDIAPNATLLFFDRGNSQIEYVNAMDTLIRQGCRIICDDITYIEPFFEDGYIAENIRDRILSYGILYVTSAGNFAEGHYQAPFAPYYHDGYEWHDFANPDGSHDLTFTVTAGCAGHVILQWDDEQGKSGNNYDLFLYDDNGHETGRSVNLQDGNGDPMEWVRFMNKGTTDEKYRVRVVKTAADNKNLDLYVLPVNGQRVTVCPNTPEGSIFGQQAVNESISVAAVSSASDNISAESFSSRGPVRISWPKPEIRQKPDIAAPDRITVSFGDNRSFIFSGTSAAAPHIAGLAALIWSIEPNLTYSQVKEQILSSGRGTGGLWNSTIGYGLPDALLLNSTGISATNLPISRTENLMPQFLPNVRSSADNITLFSGWNMISVPLPLEDGKNTASLFSNVNTDGHTIWKYLPDKRTWAAMQPDVTLNQLDVIWIYSKNNLNFPVSYDTGVMNYTSRTLYPGWNPLGIPGIESITARTLMNPLGNSWTYILVFDASTQSYRMSIINGGNGPFSAERLLNPTEGFWVYMNEPGIFMS